MLRVPLVLCGLVLTAPAFAQTVLDPNAPIGIQAGRFTVFPAVEATAAFTGGAMSPVISPEIKFQADWGALAVELFFDADFTPAGGLALATLAELNLRFDLGALWQLEANASYRVAPQSLRDPALPAGVDAAPNARTIAAGATVGGPIGGLDVALRAAVQRNAFDDAVVAGVPVDQSERNNTLVSATLRLATAGRALFTPFVEASLGRRIYDQPVGTDGFLQAGNFAALRGGIAYDSGPVLTGEVALGYHWELPDDPALAVTRGVTLDASANWSPLEPLMFRLALSTAFNPDASPLHGGSVSRRFDFDASWQIRETVQLTALGGYGIETFADGTTERFAEAGGAIVWSPDRWLRFSAGYTQSWLWSPDPGRTGTTGTFLLTARVQR